jgi:DeoR family transcriptional regulator of aga operon
MPVRTAAARSARGVVRAVAALQARRHASGQQRIAKAVADLMAPGEVVGRRGGTTTMEVARSRFAVFGQVRLDVAVLGVVPLDVRHGATAHAEAEAAINRLPHERAEWVIVATGSGEPGRPVFAPICGTEAVGNALDGHRASEDTMRLSEEAGRCGWRPSDVVRSPRIPALAASIRPRLRAGCVSGAGRPPWAHE